MTPKEFKIEVLGDCVKNYSEKEIEVYYTTTTKLFNYLFEKWKKEKFPHLNP